MAAQPDKIRETLSAFVDGELSAKDAKTVQEVLAKDAALAAEAQSLRSVRQLVGALPRAAAPAGLAQRVLARAERTQLLDDTDHRAVGGGSWFGRLSAAAAVLMAVGIGASLIMWMSSRSWLDRVAWHGADKAPAVAARPTDGDGKPGSGLHSIRGASVSGRGGGGGGGAIGGGGAFGDHASGLSGDETKYNSISDGDVSGSDARSPGGPSAKPAPAVFEAGEAIVVNVVINTADLPNTQKDFERILTSNDVAPAVVTAAEPAAASPEAKVAPAKVADQVVANSIRRNNYRQEQPAPRQVRYVVEIDAPQVAKFVGEVNELRARQNVAQLPVTERDKELMLAQVDAVASNVAQTKGGLSESLADAHNTSYKHGEVDQPAPAAALAPTTSPASEHRVSKGATAEVTAKIGKVRGENDHFAANGPPEPVNASGGSAGGSTGAGVVTTVGQADDALKTGGGAGGSAAGDGQVASNVATGGSLTVSGGTHSAPAAPVTVNGNDLTVTDSTQISQSRPARPSDLTRNGGGTLVMLEGTAANQAGTTTNMSQARFSPANSGQNLEVSAAEGNFKSESTVQKALEAEQLNRTDWNGRQFQNSVDVAKYEGRKQFYANSLKGMNRAAGNNTTTNFNNTGVNAFDNGCVLDRSMQDIRVNAGVRKMVIILNGVPQE
jgi:hypothetical protein